jgi:hypothetical protein
MCYGTVRCTRWMPCALTGDKKAARLMVSLVAYSRENNSPCWVTAGDDRAVSLFTHTSERSTMEWEHPGSPRTLSASKVLGSAFWIHRMHHQWTSWNMDIQLMPSSEPHWKACHRPSGECPSLLSDGVILLCKRMATHSTAKFWIRNAGEYSPDLAPIDFIYFPPWVSTYHNIVSPLMKT